jgi:hypothetical protein
MAARQDEDPSAPLPFGKLPSSEESTDISAESDASRSLDASTGPWPESVILLALGALLSLDLASDAETGRSTLHVRLELGAACLAIVALGWIWARWMRTRRELERRLDDLARRLRRRSRP